MVEFLLAFVAFAFAMLGLALGQLFGRGSVSGSCGGLSAIPGIDSDCGGSCRRSCKRRRASTRRQNDQ